MTCASCANRVERKLNKLDGVVATSTSPPRRRTSPTRPRSTGRARRGGRGGGLHGRRCPSRSRAGEPPTRPGPCATAAWSSRRWRCRWSCCPWSRRCSSPTGSGSRSRSPRPPSCGAAWPLHRAAAGQPAPRRRHHGHARSRSAPSAALGWSVVRACCAARGMTYLEVGAAVTAFVLLGRWLEARSKRRAGAALTALLDLGAKEASVLRDGGEVRVPAAALQVGDRFVVRPGETIATDGVVDDGTLRAGRGDAHRRVGAGRGAGRATRSSAGAPTSAAVWWCAPPGSAPTPSSPGWPASSRTRRAARPRSSGWPTGCRGCSCRS